MSKTVEGVTISGYGHHSLADDLESYRNWSPTAKALLIAAGNAGATIQVQRAGGICHADKTTVQISRDACLDAATGLTSGSYMAESALFELQNAVNEPQYTRIRRDVRSGTTSILQYGLRLATLEFESTATVARIVGEVQGRGKPVSPWGLKQRAAAPLGVGHFTSQPHVPAAADARRLPSRLFYGYSFLIDEVKQVKNMKIKALKKLAVVKCGHKTLGSLEMGQLVASWGRSHAGLTPSQFLVTYIDAVAWVESKPNWSVQWQGGSRSDWKTCAIQYARMSAIPNRKTVTEAVKRDMESVASLPG